MPAARHLVLIAAAGATMQAAPLLSWTGVSDRWLPAIRTINSTGAALTFDDGPGPGTPAFLELLAHHETRATFFVTGEQVRRHPEILRAIAAAGHEVGAHGTSHAGHLRRMPADVKRDVLTSVALIEDTIGLPVTQFRPPYGLASLGSAMAARDHGLTTVLWSRWGRDWERSASAESIVLRIGTPKHGQLLLLHDDDRYSAPGSWTRTLAALPEILRTWQAAGIPLGPVPR